MAYGVVSVGTTPTLIVPANNARRQLIIDNQSSSTVYIGPDTSISSSNAVRLLSGANMTVDAQWFLSAIYGVVSTGSANVAYWEHP